MKNIEHNYYSDVLKSKFKEVLKGSDSIGITQEIFELLFTESVDRMKKIAHKYESYLPTNKYDYGWKYGTILGFVHVLSGGISLRRTIEWESSLIKRNYDNKIINDVSSAIIIDLNGDIYSNINLSKMMKDRNGYDGALSVKFINAGLLKKRDDEFFWHGSSKSKWGMKYPYTQLQPVHISDDKYYQPFSREQIFSAILIHKVFEIASPQIKHVLGDTFFAKMLNPFGFVDGILEDDFNDYLLEFPTFLK